MGVNIITLVAATSCIFASYSAAWTDVDAVERGRGMEGCGVPVILLTNEAGDGARTGYALPAIAAIREIEICEPNARLRDRGVSIR